MTSKPNLKKRLTLIDVSYPGMMEDGTEEQTLNERGDPAAKITKAEVNAAFAGKTKTKAKDKRWRRRTHLPRIGCHVAALIAQAVPPFPRNATTRRDS